MTSLDLIRKLLLLTLLSVLLTASQCLDVDDDDDLADDDDAGNDDDDGDDDDDDDVVVGDTVITGAIIAVDRATGLELSPSQYAARAGGLIVYALPDGSDLSDVLGKDTMTGPGEYEITISGYIGPIDVVAVVDEDRNYFITNDDTLREHAFNPIAAAGNPLEDVDVIVDLAVDQGGGDDGGGDDDDHVGCNDVTLSGTVVLDGLPEGTIAVTTNSPDLTDGPWSFTILSASGPFSLTECSALGTTSLLGYLDADGNGYFEPSDPIGEGDSNPVPLSLGDVAGAIITIPNSDVDAPTPPAYVGLTGTVSYPPFVTGDILVRATHITTDSYVFSQVTLAAPGGFALLAPSDTSNVLVWAVLDDDGDGDADPAVDPFDSAGPMNTGFGVSGIALELGPSAPGVLSGTITYEGPVSPGDVLHIGVFDTEIYEPSDGPPVAQAEVLNPSFPHTYAFTVESGTFWIGAFLDLGGDDPSSAGPEDPENQVGPILLAPGGEEVSSFGLPIFP
jgi:hypothetical protein